MVSVWAADITPLLIEETYQAYYDKVPEWRKDKADKLKNVDDKARSVGAWIGKDEEGFETSGIGSFQSVTFGKICIVCL